MVYKCNAIQPTGIIAHNCSIKNQNVVAIFTYCNPHHYHPIRNITTSLLKKTLFRIVVAHITWHLEAAADAIQFYSKCVLCCAAMVRIKLCFVFCIFVCILLKFVLFKTTVSIFCMYNYCLICVLYNVCIDGPEWPAKFHIGTQIQLRVVILIWIGIRISIS